MTFALNTGHALYGNLKMLIGVNESNALVDLRNGVTTFTPHASAVFGTGTFGRHFGVRSGAGTCYGAGIVDPTVFANNTGTMILVLNGVQAAEYASYHNGPVGPESTAHSTVLMPWITLRNEKYAGMSWNGGTGAVDVSALSTTACVSATARMVTLTKTGDTAHALYIDGNATPEASGGKLGNVYTSGALSYLRIGGVNGYANPSYDLVYALWFDKVLTTTEIGDLYASLGASNSFALLEAGGGGDVTAPTLTSSTGAQTGSTTASGGVTTNENNGTLYAVCTTSGTAPTAAQVKLGQNSAGTAAAYASNQAITTTGAKTVAATGLTASTAYFWHFMHEDTATNKSSVVSSATFTTAAAVRMASLTLTTDGTTAAASLTGLKWAWFDSPNPSAWSAPVIKGAAGTTDAAGLLSLTLTGTTLTVGQIGWLVVTNSDGTTSQSPAAKAFSGPVAVS